MHIQAFHMAPTGFSWPNSWPARVRESPPHHDATTTCSVSRCHPPHRPNHLAWQWTIWTMDGFEKKNYRKLWVFDGFVFLLPCMTAQGPLCSCWMEKNVFLLAFLGVSWFSCKFSHHPKLPRLPRLPFWGLRNSERHSASGFLWNYGSI